MEIFTIVGIAILGVSLAVTVRSFRSELSLLIGMTTGVVVLLSVIGELTGVVDTLRALAEQYGVDVPEYRKIAEAVKKQTENK